MNATIRWGVVLVCTAIVVVAGVSGAAAGAGDTGVVLTSATGEITAGSTTTVEIVVGNASGGVGAVNATVTVSNGSVATITDVSLDESANTVDVRTNAANTSATVTGYGLDTNDSEAVVVGTATVRGESAGDADVGLQLNALGDESGIEYTISSTVGADLSVSEPSDGDTGGSDGGTTPTTTTAPESPTTTTDQPTNTPTTTEPRITTATATTGSQAPGFAPLTTVTALLCAALLLLGRAST